MSANTSHSILAGVALALGCVLPISAQPHEHAAPGPHGQGPTHGMHHDFSDAERYSKQFDSDERRAWQKPDEVLDILAIAPGMTVADIGAGTGFFEPYLAAAVGADGKVLALDVESGMVDFLRKRVADEGLANVEPRRVEPDDPGLGSATVDRILVVDTWHHIDDRAAYSARLREALKPGGTVTVVDFERSSPHGPPPQHRLTSDQVAAELEAGGLHAETVSEDLEYQYVVVARR